MSINPKTNKTIKVKYNLSNRKLLLEEYQYTSSGISSDQNTITISNHNLLSGQKVINELTTDVGSGEEFKSDKEYFVYVIDENTIIDKLKEIGPLPPQAQLFTCDAVSMYTNIDSSHGPEIIAK